MMIFSEDIFLRCLKGGTGNRIFQYLHLDVLNECKYTVEKDENFLEIPLSISL